LCQYHSDITGDGGKNEISGRDFHFKRDGIANQ